MLRPPIFDYGSAADPDYAPLDRRIVFMRHSSQRFSYPVPGHLRPLDRAIEPAAHIGGEFLTFQVMAQGLSEPRAQPARRFPARILMRKIVVGKAAKHRSRDPDAVIRRKRRFEADVSPPGDCLSTLQQSQREGLQAGRRRGLVYKVESSLPRLGD